MTLHRHASSYTVRDTYVIDDPHRLGEVIASVTDALSGRVRAVYLDSLGKPRDVIVGENLCSGCDQPVADGECGCSL